MEFGQSAEMNLAREIQEETGLEAEIGRLLFVTEYLHSPLHAVELFFEARITGGTLITGRDPEMETGNQLIREARYLSPKEIDELPPEAKHGLFKRVPTSGRIGELNGYFRI